MQLDQIDWEAVLNYAAAILEKNYSINLDIDIDIVREIKVNIEKSLSALEMDGSVPNVAKVAGHVVYWIRKLKPITHAQDSSHKLLTANESAAIVVGMSICRQYITSSFNFNPPKRVMFDWAVSLRKHNHSPHSCAITFELLVSEK